MADNVPELGEAVATARGLAEHYGAEVEVFKDHW